MSPPIHLQNTLTHTKEPLRTERPGRVTMYVCGPTVYNYAHIGNARPAVVFDVLSRLLRHDYRELVYARNFTDVDDKINAAAAAAGVPIGAITDRYIAAYHEDMHALGVLTPDLPGWDSPWGRGRPGWHIECSAMIGQHLGHTIDIHGGGQDLIFPHHENEVAQGTCAHGTLYCRTWVHNSFVTVDGQKMSKSLGNVLLVRDLLDQAPGEAIRLALLSTHYRKPLDWNAQRLQGARHALTRYYDSLAKVAHLDVLPQTAPDPEVVEAARNDLNIPGALVRLHVLLTQLEEADTDTQRAHAKSVLLTSAGVMGLLQQAPQAALAALRPTAPALSADDARFKTLLAERELARRERDFAKADALREELEAAGFMIEDTPAGPVVRPAATECA